MRNKRGHRYRFYLFMQEGLERYGHRVLAFCLMTNHIHLAIQVTDVPLSRKKKWGQASEIASW